MPYKPTIEQLLSQIANRHLWIPTLEERKSDSLDFHEVSVWSLKKALQEAYEAGQKNLAKK
jgi:hypothetical protein